jgi:hypothetical protein
VVRDIKADLIEFLRSHVGDAAISVAFTPDDDIGFEQYDDADQDIYVTASSEDPAVPAGGQTQYSGVDPGGAGGIQDVVTSLQIDCWGGDIDADAYAGVDSHPDIVANELAREVHRVLFEAGESGSGPPTPSGYEWINAEPPREANDVERSPTKYRRIVIARTKHTETP